VGIIGICSFLKGLDAYFAGGDAPCRKAMPGFKIPWSAINT
jgi:hypothetical protein